jgi:mono/diheme cytochrome c family protein
MSQRKNRARHLESGAGNLQRDSEIRGKEHHMSFGTLRSANPRRTKKRYKTSHNGNPRKLTIAVLLAAVLALAALCMSRAIVTPAAAQENAPAPASSGGDSVARGKYIVEDVAMCGNCHTPRLANGELDRSRWLAGASNPYLPAQPRRTWPINAPRLAGSPPATDVWIDGKPLDDPMPHFHMTRSDAEAVVAYLRSLR